MADSTSIKLADGLRDRLRAIAEAENRSPNWLMNEAISHYVERKESRKALLDDLREAHREFQETGLHLTQEEVEEWMARRASGERAPMPKLHT